MVYCPLQFLDRDQDLAETGINLRLAAIEAAYFDYLVLMFEDVFKESAQHLAALRECGSCPVFLYIRSSIGSRVNVCSGCWYYERAQASAVCWAVWIDLTIAYVRDNAYFTRWGSYVAIMVVELLGRRDGETVRTIVSEENILQYECDSSCDDYPERQRRPTIRSAEKVTNLFLFSRLGH